MIVSGILNRPRLTLALTALFVLTGCLCMWNLPVEKFPSVSPPTFRIKLQTQGFDAKDADGLVMQPLLNSISDVSDVLYHSSVSVSGGESRCDVTFRAGADGELALLRLREAVRSAELQMPAEVVRKGVSVLRNVDDVVLTCAVRSRSNEPLSIRTVADMKSRVLSLAGVEGVEIDAAADKTVRVVLDPVKLAGLGLSVSDVARVLDARRPQVGLLGPSHGSSLRVEGFRMSVADLEDIVIRDDPQTGGRVMLKNVGCVVLSDDRVCRTRLDGRDAIVFKVRKKAFANAADTAKAVRDVIGECIGGREGFETVYIADASSDVKTFLRTVAMAPLMAVLLIALVMFLFLRSVREVMVPLFVAAASVVGSFVFQAWLGFTFNALTILGFVLVIGSLVDDALVVIEMARADRAVRKLSAKDAMSAAVRRSLDVLAVSTFISAVCYLPLVFVKGMASEMYLQFAFTSCMALALSAVFAAALAPVLFVVLVRAAPVRAVKRNGMLAWCARRWRLAWHASTGFWTARPWLAVVVLLAAACSFAVFRQILPKTFFGDAAAGSVVVEVAALKDVTSAETVRLGGEVAGRLMGVEGVKHVLSVHGQGGLSGGGDRFLRLTLVLHRPLSSDGLDRFIDEVRRVTSDIENVAVSALAPSPVQGVGRFAGLEFHLTGSKGGDGELQSAMYDFAGKVSGLDGVCEVVTPLALTDSRVKLTVDAEKAESMGVSPAAAASVLRGRFEPKVLKGFALSDGVFDVELSEFAELGADAHEVSRMLLPVSGGGLVSVSSLGSVSEEPVPQYVGRFRGAPAVGGVVRIEPGAAPERVMREMSAIPLPDGVNLEWSGIAVQESVNRGGTRMMIGLSLLFAYLLLVAWYESWVLPLPSVGTAAIAVFGSLWGLCLAGEPLDFHAQVALVAVVGIALKGSSLIVDAIRDEHERGRSLRVSALAGAVRVFRPVQMTIWTSLFGVIPFLVTAGVGMSAQRVLGVVSVSGVLTVLLCGFTLTPALYIVAERLRGVVSKKPMRTRRRRLWKSGGANPVKSDGELSGKE